MFITTKGRNALKVMIDLARHEGEGFISLGDIADTAENTGKMAKSLEITEEDLKYLKDLAEREVINRFTTAEIRLEMHNNNTISGTNDIDGIVDYLGQRLEEMMVTAAEGVHD